MDVLIFSYGTLQMPRVQRELLGRLVQMDDDALLGFETVAVEIDHPDVIEFSGSSTHLGLVPGAPDARIAGKLLHVTEADLPALDDYEGEEYTRVEVTLASGRRAWVYVAA
ncbi:MAG: gamma-glutamylcyclotransferase family protein [Sphingomonas sp.]